MKKHLLVISSVLLIMSILAIYHGAYLQSNTQQFDLYQQYVVNDMATRHPGDALAPELGIGLVLASAWSIVGFIHALICLFFLVGLLCVRNNHIRFGNKSPYIFTSLLFTFFCAVSSLHYAYIALDSFMWLFYLRGAGEIFAAIGLLTVAFALLREIDILSLLNNAKMRFWNVKQSNIP